MNYQYSRDYHPSAPIIDVTLISTAESLRTGSISALVDSGADGTIVPIAYLDEIHAHPRRRWSFAARLLPNGRKIQNTLEFNHFLLGDWYEPPEGISFYLEMLHICGVFFTPRN